MPSHIGLGLAALGRPGYINLGHAADLGREYTIEAMEARAHAVLDAAWARGIRYFDAARSYGRAEAFLGSWLGARNIPANAVTVGSKWGYTYTANWKVEADRHEVKEHSLPVLRQQIAESRQLLGDRLKLYQIHSATLESGVLDNRPVLEELARLRGDGVQIGLTLSGVNQAQTLQKAMRVEMGGDRLFDSVQATWNLLETSATAQLQQAHAAGMTVIVKEALANGRLTARNDDPAFASSRQVLDGVAAQLDTTLDALALAAALAQPWASIVLSGAATSEQLVSNLNALHVAWNDAVARSLAVVREEPHAYWRTRSQLAWN